jgi:hypothetical protein
MLSSLRSMLLLYATLLSACTTASTFVTSQKTPDAAPLELRGEKVAAVVLLKSDASRRLAEDTLAREISARGAQGVAMYTILPDATPSKEAATRTALENAGVKGVVVMRPISVDNKADIKPATALDETYYRYWDGYYAHSTSLSYAAPITVGVDIKSTTTVYVETMVYSLKQNKLVWTGQSKSVDPPRLEEFVKQLAADVASELQSKGLIKR